MDCCSGAEMELLVIYPQYPGFKVVFVGYPAMVLLKHNITHDFLLSLAKSTLSFAPALIGALN